MQGRQASAVKISCIHYEIEMSVFINNVHFHKFE